MAYSKTPRYTYNSLGGVNNKVSPYLNSAMEFLNLQNFDFQIPGSLTSRWGSTQYFGASLSGKVNGLYEFVQTSGASYFIAAAGGTLGFATNGGFSSIFSGSTAGNSYLVVGVSGLDGYSLSSFDLDFDTFQNQAFFANGKNFLKYTGSSVVFFGLPRFQAGSTYGFNTIFLSAKGTSIADGLTGYYYYKLAWQNSYGLAGTPCIATTQSSSSYFFFSNAIATAGASSVMVSVWGATNGLQLVPKNFDITGIAVFRSGPTATDLTSGATAFSSQINVIGNTYKIATTIENLEYTFMGSMGVSSGSLAATFIDSSVDGGATFMDSSIIPWMWYPLPDQSTSFSLTLPAGQGITLIPRMIETFDNRIFAAGFSNALSTFYFSELAQPENWQPDGNIEVRTNDGEGISALKAYNGNMMVFKPSSFHTLDTSSLDPQLWSLTQVSAEYGCLSNRAIAEYNDLLVFLDRKGIIRFNGANIEILSTKVDPIFQRMNVSAAKSQALMTYDKQRNQILCDIPVDGATMNNLTVVWDMVSNCWTTYAGYRPAVIAVGQGQLTNDQIFMGGYSGLVSYFGASYTSDNGIGFTCIAKSGFAHDLGYATESLFRRLYSDMVPQGSSAFVDVNFYQDYGASIVFGATIAQTPFQTKIELGIPARSLAVEYVKGGTYAMIMHGFTIEYRFLRNI